MIPDLLGVPEDDRKEFCVVLDAERLGSQGRNAGPRIDWGQPVRVARQTHYCSYIEDQRRKKPCNGVLAALATTRYPDGSTFRVIDIVRSATFSCSRPARKNTARLLSVALQVLSNRARYPATGYIRTPP